MIIAHGNDTHIKPRTIQGYVQSLAGVFKLTPREVKIFAALLYLLDTEGKTEVDSSIKAMLADVTNYSPQVVTNYINKFKRKKILEGNEPHYAFTSAKVVIYNDKEQNESSVQPSSTERGSERTRTSY